MTTIRFIDERDGRNRECVEEVEVSTGVWAALAFNGESPHIATSIKLADGQTVPIEADWSIRGHPFTTIEITRE